MDHQLEATAEPTANLAQETAIMEPKSEQPTLPSTEAGLISKTSSEDHTKPQQTTDQNNGSATGPVADSGRRRSTRVRRAPASYVPETIVLRPQRVTQKETRQRKKQEAAKAAAKLAKANGAKPASKKQPQFMAKVRYCDTEAVPNFEAIELTSENTELFWLKLAMREFFLRFDKLCRLPVRHAATISDPLAEWNDYVFKAAILSLFRIILNDSQPVCSQAKTYFAAIEHTQAESAELWTVLADFLAEADVRPESARQIIKQEQELAGEHGRLVMLRRLQVLASSSETIRLTVTGDQEELVALQKDNLEEIANQRKAFSETEAKLAKLKAHDEDLYYHRHENAKRAADSRIHKLEQTMYLQLRKYNLRTAPLGTDNFGNKYWGLQHRAKSDETWGSYIVCEMKRLPKEDDAKKLTDYVDQLLARAPKRKRDVKTGDGKQKSEPKKKKVESEKAGPQEQPESEMPKSAEDSTVKSNDEQAEPETSAVKVEAVGAAETQALSPPQIPQVDGLPEETMDIDPENIESANSEQISGSELTGPALVNATNVAGAPGVPSEGPAVPATSEPAPAAQSETLKPAIKKIKISVKKPHVPKTADPKQPKKPKETEANSASVAPKKPRQRKPKMPVFDQQGGLFKVSGADELKKLAKWIENQPGPKHTALVTEIENMAAYLY